MLGKIFGWIKEILLYLVLLAVILNVISYIRKPELSSDKLPKFTYQSINNKIISSGDFKNKPLLIHFWATWCPTCKLEASNIQTLSKEYSVVTVIVNSGSNEEIKDYMQKNVLNYITINDANGEISSKFNVSAFPTTFIYDKYGEISFSEVGYTSSLGLKLRMWLSSK